MSAEREAVAVVDGLVIPAGSGAAARAREREREPRVASVKRFYGTQEGLGPPLPRRPSSVHVHSLDIMVSSAVGVASLAARSVMHKGSAMREEEPDDVELLRVQPLPEHDGESDDDEEQVYSSVLEKVWHQSQVPIEAAAAETAEKLDCDDEEESPVVDTKAEDAQDTDVIGEAEGGDGGGKDEPLGFKARVAMHVRHLKHPWANERLLWNGLAAVCVVWQCVSIPLRLSFRSLWQQQQSSWLITDYLSDLVFVVDMFIRFQTYYYDEGIYVTDAVRCRRHYLKSWFVVDLLSVIPIDFISFSVVWKHAALRANRFLRISHIVEYFALWELHLHTWSQRMRFLKLIFGVLLMTHWLTCGYQAFSYAKGFGATNWTPPADVLSFSVWAQYVWAFWFAANTVTRVGGAPPYPVDTDEKVTVFLYGFLILFVTSSLVGAIVGVINQVNLSVTQFRNKMSEVNAFMARRQISTALQKRVRFYFFHLWSKQGGSADSSVLKQLPPRLRTEVALAINRELYRVPIFVNAVPGFLNALVHELEPEIYGPNDVIMQEGDVGVHMYFVKKGTLSVEVSGSVVATLGPGDAFGEVALLIPDSRRTATIRAQTFCDLYSLSKSGLNTVLQDFPEQRLILRKMADVRKGTRHLLQLLSTNEHTEALKFDIHSEFSKAFIPIMDMQDEAFVCMNFEPARSVYFIVTGKVFITDDKGNRVKELEMGNCFGSLDGHPYGVNAQVRGDRVVLSELTKDSFQQLLQEHVPKRKARRALKAFCNTYCRKMMKAKRRKSSVLPFTPSRMPSTPSAAMPSRAVASAPVAVTAEPFTPSSETPHLQVCQKFKRVANASELDTQTLMRLVAIMTRVQSTMWNELQERTIEVQHVASEVASLRQSAPVLGDESPE